jgi:hypothetical protein
MDGSSKYKADFDRRFRRAYPDARPEQVEAFFRRQLRLERAGSSSSDGWRSPSTGYEPCRRCGGWDHDDCSAAGIESDERERFERDFLEDHPEASPEQVRAAWGAEGGIRPVQERHHEPAVAPDGAAAEADQAHRAAELARPGNSDPEAWNELLQKEGHGVIEAPAVSNRERDRALRQPPKAAEAELADRNQAGLGTVIHEAPLDPGGTGRKLNRTKAVKVTMPDGRTRYRAIKNDTGAIEEWLGRHRPVDEYRAVLGRGRPTADTREIRVELCGVVYQLLQMDADKRAVASILGCSWRTADLLARAGEKAAT